MAILYLLSLCALFYLIKLGAEFLLEDARRKKKAKFDLRGLAIDQASRNVIARALQRLHYPMRELPTHFRMYTANAAHLGASWTGILAGGHLCSSALNTICLSVESISYTTVWHEMGHLYHWRLNREGSEFGRRWWEVAGEVYHRNFTLPNNSGILTPYSRGDMMEDIAEWVSECYVYLYYGVNTGIASNPEVKKDPRYRRKLALLYEYGFLSRSDYKKLKPLFE